MIEKFKYTLKHTFAYSIGNFSIKLIGFILLPFYTSTLTVAQYGILTILETTLNILSPISLLNINGGLIRYFNEVNEKRKGSLLFTALVYVVISGILLNILFQPLSTIFSKLIFQTSEYKNLFNILFINVALQNITLLIRSYYNAQEKPLYFSLLNFIRFTFVLVFTIYFLIVLKLSLKGIFLAQTLSFVLTILLFLPSYLKKLAFQFDRHLLIKMLNYSVPLAFSSITSLILSFGDRYVLKFLMNEASVGIYSLAAKLANVLEFIILSGFRLAYNPYAFRTYKNPDFKVFHARITTYLTLIISTLALFLSLLSYEIIIIFSPKNPDYWEAAKYVPALSFIKILYGLQYIFSIALFLKKKTKHIALIVTISATLNILLNLLLIPIFHIYGAIISSLIAVLIMIVYYYIVSQKYYKINYEFLRIFYVIFVVIIIYAASTQIHFKPITYSILAKISLMLLYPLLLYFAGFFRKSEIETLKRIWKKFKIVK